MALTVASGVVCGCHCIWRRQREAQKFTFSTHTSKGKLTFYFNNTNVLTAITTSIQSDIGVEWKTHWWVRISRWRCSPTRYLQLFLVTPVSLQYKHWYSCTRAVSIHFGSGPLFFYLHNNSSSHQNYGSISLFYANVLSTYAVTQWIPVLLALRRHPFI